MSRLTKAQREKLRDAASSREVAGWSWKPSTYQILELLDDLDIAEKETATLRIQLEAADALVEELHRIDRHGNLCEDAYPYLE